MKVNQKIISFSLIMLHLVQFSTLYAQQGDEKHLYGAELGDVEYTNEGEGKTFDGTNPVLNHFENEILLAQSDLKVNSTVIRESTPMAQSPVVLSGAVLNQSVMEQIQVAELSDTIPNQKTVAGFFIFRNKPTSFFYEVKQSEKKLIFEFNDTKVDTFLTPVTLEKPITNFEINQIKIDVNKLGMGLNPEWHDMVRVVFDLEMIPDIEVTDEGSIISFVFKWTTNPPIEKKYVAKKRPSKALLFTSIGVGGSIALGALAYLFLKPDPQPQPVGEPLGNLSTLDLPAYPVEFK